MKLISEENYLQHYGVPGMKWGKRKAGLKAWGKEAGKVTKNNLLHPIITGKANKESIRSEKTFGAKARRSAAYQNTKDLKDVNARIDKMLADKKKTKLKDIDGTNWFKEANKASTNSSLHRSITKQANKESIRSEKSMATRMRRRALFQNTKELSDVNSRIDQMLAEKRKAR